jgi:eukaryotic-like serine/threonine-protein kinase
VLRIELGVYATKHAEVQAEPFCSGLLITYDLKVVQGLKGDGRAKGAWAGEASSMVGGPSGRVSHAAMSPSALHSWRPSAGLLPVERYGRFEILGRIGRGGMAEILLARERSLAGSTRHLVIKRVLPDADDAAEMLHMFLDEARVVMGLSHPNLCQIYEVGEQEGAWFIAMEWVNGATLHQLIRRAFSEGDVDHAIIARVIAHCAEALHHAHTARDADGRPLHLVHRDVSPHNIMLGYDGRVKLLDFGIAKSTKSTHQTEAGVVKGKVCYMAPEQWLSGPLDARTDVFALGTCLYEALTGRVVFRRETQSEVMRAVLREGAPLLSEVAPEVPAVLAEITHRALSFSPDDRFQSALEMAEALDQFIALRSAPLAAARVASYVRRLFRSEVELGPILERQVRGAHLASAPVVLPPLPPALLGLPKLTPSMLGLPDPEEVVSEGAAPALLLPPAGAASAGPQRTGATVADRVPAQAARVPYAEDLTESTERPLSAPPSDEELDAAGESLDQPPQQEALAQARPAARTLSMHVRSSVRRVALITVPCALAMFAAMYSLLPTPVAPVSLALAPRVLRVASAPAAQAASPASEHVAEAPPIEAPALPPEASSARAAKREAKPGKLSINTRPWSTVYLGNRVLGTTPLANISVPRSMLTLKLVDRDGNVHLRRLSRTRAIERSAFYDFQTPLKRTRRR